MSISTLVLEMDEHGLADAFRDPMMMGLGAMVIAAGAYMAIVMQVWSSPLFFGTIARNSEKFEWNFFFFFTGTSGCKCVCIGSSFWKEKEVIFSVKLH